MTSKNRARLLAGTGGLLALGAIATTAAWSKRESAAPRTTAPETKSAAPADPEAANDTNDANEPQEDVARDPGCKFAPGDKLTYALETIVKTVIDTSAAHVDPSINDSAALTRVSRATLVMRAISIEPKRGAVLLARFQDVDAVTSKAAGDITPPFLVRVDGACKIAGYAHLRTTPLLEARTAQALLHELQFAWSNDGESTGLGENRFGAYAANFAAGKGPTIERRIRTYTQAWEDAWSRALDVDEPAAMHEHAPLASEMTVRAGRGPWFESLRSFERMPGAMASVAETRTTARAIGDRSAALEGQPTNGDAYVWENLLPRKVRTRETPVVSQREQKELAQLKTVPLDDAMKKFTGRVERKENIATQWPELSKWLRANPDMTAAVVKQLRSGQIPDEATAAVFIALGKAPTEEAKKELLAINADVAAPTVDRTRAAFALVDREDVGIDFARTLHTDSRAVSTGRTRSARIYAREATLALGMMAALKGEDHPEIMQEGHQAALELIQQSPQTALALRPAFKAVANMGDPSLLPSVTPYMAHADPQMRKSAAIAFRRMAPSQTASLTAEWLAREPDREVKRAIYHVVQLQLHDAEAIAAPEIIERAIADLDARPGPITRQSLVRILGRAAATTPAAKAALMRHVRAELDAHEGVEETLSKYLTAAEMSAAAKGAR